VGMVGNRRRGGALAADVAIDGLASHCSGPGTRVAALRPLTVGIGSTRSVSEMTASIDDFCADGFLVLRGAVAPDTVRACMDVIENELHARWRR